MHCARRAVATPEEVRPVRSTRAPRQRQRVERGLKVRVHRQIHRLSVLRGAQQDRSSLDAGGLDLRKGQFFARATICS